MILPPETSTLCPGTKFSDHPVTGLPHGIKPLQELLDVDLLDHRHELSFRGYNMGQIDRCE